ncbi:MAG TPA: tRNA (adenosine(37)-N6)-threonylcarbamoyltransferase complex transferase subunit TsaD [bacterium]|nr:tRNA (adenosine(37)-N6)-threonylcarbamoyltransferase complex transferase subunit TsaD [bacterium]
MTRYILGIESSCDDTSAAVVDEHFRVLAVRTVSQTNLHALFGGVIPEIAARNHIAWIFPTIDKALSESGVAPTDLSAVAVTNYPGLLGSLLVGVGAAKGLAIGWGKPLIAVNHLEAHIHSPFLGGRERPKPPYLALVVSGGHTTLMAVGEGSAASVLAETMDDAAGEAYDKIAKIAKLSYPGGPAIDKIAQTGDPSRYDLPHLMRSGRYKDTLAFSFSGIKSAVKRILEEEGDTVALADLMAGFQSRIVELIERRLTAAWEQKAYTALVVAGGVAANSAVRKMAQEFTGKRRVPLYLPELTYCQDNGAMVAAAAFPKLDRGDLASLDLDVTATSRPQTK